MAGKQHKPRQAVSVSSEDAEDIPTGIAGNKDKMELWRFIVADLRNRGLYSSTYTFVIAETVSTVFMLSEQEALLEEEGPVIDSLNKGGDVVGTRPNPRFDVVHRLKSLLLKLVEKLGLSPRDATFLVPGEVLPEQATELAQPGTKGIVHFRD
jgi:hypothetical protein